jgi:hypothetical protein
MTRPERSARPGGQLLALLERFAEILPSEPLRSLQSASQQGELTDKLLTQRLSAQGQSLIGFGVATSTNAALLQGLPETHLTRLTELGEYIKSHAPVLLEHPRIQDIAREIAASLDQSAQEADLPYDDISAIRAAHTYLSVGGRLVPTVRVAISFSNREDFQPLSLRLIDVAHLAIAFTGTLTQVVENSKKVARSGLLDASELDDVRQMLVELDSELSKLKSGLEEEVFAQAGPQAAVAE